MRKVIYICFVSVIFCSCGASSDSEVNRDWRYDLRKNSTEPFGCFLASNSLENLFPNATIENANSLFADLDKANNQTYFQEHSFLNIIVTNDFYPTVDEVDVLMKYIDKGGNVFLAAAATNPLFDSAFNTHIISEELEVGDSNLVFRLMENKDRAYSMKFPWVITYLDSTKDIVLGQQKIKKGYGTIVTKSQRGKGLLIFCTAPEILSNYFLIKDSNINYYENIFSHFNRYMNKIRWQSQITYNGNYQRPESNLYNLLKQKEYLAAFLVLLALLILYLLFESKRRQRAVPLIAPVKNESLEFTETVGRLYYHQSDHKNLGNKMVRYYLEYIRTKYNIPTSHLDNTLASKLSRRLSTDTKETEAFVSYISKIKEQSRLAENDIKFLYNQLKKYS
jgi:hypothetical protein